MRAAATALVLAACVASLFFYRDFETAVGRRFIAGYHTHHRTDPAVGAFDEPPTAVVSTHTKSAWGLAAVWALRAAYALLLFGAPLFTWRVGRDSGRSGTPLS